MQPDVAGVQPCPDRPARLRRLRELDDDRDRVAQRSAQSLCSAGRRARREQEQPRRVALRHPYQAAIADYPGLRSGDGCPRSGSAFVSSRAIARPGWTWQDDAGPMTHPASTFSRGSHGRLTAHDLGRFARRVAVRSDRAGRSARPSACRARSCTKRGRWRGACGGCAAAAASSTSAAATGCSRTSCCCSTTPRRARSSSIRHCRPHTGVCTRCSSPSGRGWRAA